LEVASLHFFFAAVAKKKAGPQFPLLFFLKNQQAIVRTGFAKHLTARRWFFTTAAIPAQGANDGPLSGDRDYDRGKGPSAPPSRQLGQRLHIPIRN